MGAAADTCTAAPFRLRRAQRRGDCCTARCTIERGVIYAAGPQPDLSQSVARAHAAGQSVNTEPPGSSCQRLFHRVDQLLERKGLW
jgi:hypothetical protein